MDDHGESFSYRISEVGMSKATDDDSVWTLMAADSDDDTDQVKEKAGNDNMGYTSDNAREDELDGCNECKHIRTGEFKMHWRRKTGSLAAIFEP